VSQDRFSRLEGHQALPPKVLEAISKLDRFSYLEIGKLDPAPAVAPSSDKILCRHCGQLNEKERDHCWACFRYVGAKAESASPSDSEMELVLDGKSYKSSDPQVPEDIQRLMGRIQKEGYSPQLMAEWRNWRATRNSSRAAEKPEKEGSPGRDLKVFRGGHVSVIRIDGKNYTSKDADLSPELKEIFDYIQKNDITPELMDHLRRHGTKVKFRPYTTADPTDGDKDFWQSVHSLLDLPTGMGEGDSGRWRVWGVVISALAALLYYVAGGLFRKFPR
jgi:hypothetical protein